jgi:hypothetical protein
VDGVDYVIHGGSCHSPVVKTDILIGLDAGFTPDARAYPWNDNDSFLFKIKDMGVPESISDFRKLLGYIKDSLLKGKSVFVGCIGGHGRTGMVLSALVTFMTDEKDSITYVRENYCEKAVESSQQVKWLGKHFGITKVKGYKEGMFSAYAGKSGGGYSNGYGYQTNFSGFQTSGYTKEYFNESEYLPIPNNAMSLHQCRRKEKESL